jgi:hypothetical protein
MLSRLLASLRVISAIAALVAAGMMLTFPAAAHADAEVRTDAWLPGALSSADDRDQFRFRVNTVRTVLVTLGDVGADLRLRLFDASGRQRGASNQPGTSFEQLQLRLPAGQYTVEVGATPGAEGAGYRLLIRALPERPLVLDAHANTAAGLYTISGQLLNNTGSWRRHPCVTARFYDGAGRFLGSFTALAAQSHLGPRQRGHFRLVAERPAGAVRYTLTVHGERVAPPVQPALALRPDEPYPVKNGQVRYVGRIAGAATSVHVHVLRYNRIGAFVDAGHVLLPRLGQGESGRYETELPSYPYVRGERVAYSLG